MKRLLTVIACFLFIALAFFDIANFADAGRRGLNLFTGNVLPILFPFFFVTSVLVGLDFFTGIAPIFAPITKRLFKTSGQAAPVWLLGLLSGYPTGARMLSELYTSGQISHADALKTATFTSTSSPVFIIATVGSVMFGSIAFGLLVFIATTAGAIINGIMFRNISFTSCKISPQTPTAFLTPMPRVLGKDNLSNIISNSLASSIQSILAVGGLIIIFFVVTSQIDNIFNLGWALEIIVAGTLEMTTGVFVLSAHAQLGGITTLASLVIATAIVTFGGLCVAMQGFVFFKNLDMSLGFYLLYKTTHTIFAVAVVTLLHLVLF